jgi:hypothetical protein
LVKHGLFAWREAVSLDAAAQHQLDVNGAMQYQGLRGAALQIGCFGYFETGEITASQKKGEL